MRFAALSRRWKTVVVVSLTLNLLVLGMVVGAILGPGAGPSERNLRSGPAFAAALAPEDRHTVFRAFRKGGGLDRRGQRERLTSVLAALRSDTFDPEKVRGLLGEQRAFEQARASRGETAILDRLVAMSPEERRAYADRLEQLIRKRRR